MPSGAAFDALNADPSVTASEIHRVAAVEDGYRVAVDALIADLPGATGGSTTPVVTADGTGTPCESDMDCPGGGVDHCMMLGAAGGICTREGCGGGDCQSPYVCCRGCSPIVQSMLPFDGAACLPAAAVTQLSAAPASCTCD